MMDQVKGLRQRGISAGYLGADSRLSIYVSVTKATARAVRGS